VETQGLAPIELIGKDPRQIKENKIISIAVMNIEEDKKDCFYGDDEKKILTDFSSFIKNQISLIGFNCEFDLNFIRVRCFINNIVLPMNFKNAKIINLRKILNSYEYAYGTLGEYCKFIGCDVKTENGKMMPIFFETKQWDKIRDHNLEDLELTLAVYNRCRDCNLL
jgi:hypothetical protein